MSREFNLDEVKEFISRASVTSNIYIGADSERYRGRDNLWYADYTVAIVVHFDGSRGCKIFGQVTTERDYDRRHDRPAYRLMNEVFKASEMYLELADAIGDKYVEVHLDISSDEVNGSSCVIQQATGYIRGMCGFAPKIKPEAFAATYAADRLKEILSN